MTPRKISILLFLSVALVILSAVEVVACTCAGRRSVKNFQPCGIFWSADVVFIGTAEKVSIVQIGTDEKTKYSKMVVRFSIEKRIRGIEGNTVEVETNPGGGNCGYPFVEGERYFAYLRRGEDGKLSERLCGPTIPLKEAAADLEYLRAVENGDTGGKIFGNVFQTVKKSYKDPDEYLPVAKTKIFLKSIPVKYADNRKSPKYKKIKLETRTDDKGFYIFQNVPAGTYTVKAEFQNGLRELYTREDLTEHYVSIDEDKRRCNGHNFNSTSKGSIEGRVVGSDGQTPPPQQYVTLIPLDENGKFYTNHSWLGVWTNKVEAGRFYFNAVPPGKYLLAINPKNCPSREKSEFGRMFFPSVGSESEAVTISVAEYERKKIPDFRLLPSLKERVFSGTVLTADRTPVSDAKVSLFAGNLNGCESYSEIIQIKTDESGRFQLKGYESYAYRIKSYSEKNPRRMHSEFTEIPASGNFENLELIVSKSY